ncbi:MAG: glutathione S-transferase N-terminal domain-containing protein [Stenotrophobium sp.]
MSLRARSKFVPDHKLAVRSGVTLFCARDNLRCHWARIVLAEKDVDGARTEWVTPGKPSEDLLVLNPSLSLPTLTDRDTVIHPERVIVEYLDERYPHPKLLPPDPAARALVRMTLLRIEQELFPLVEHIIAGGGDLRSARKTLTGHLITSAKLCPARGWFMGLEFSLADCAWAAVLYRLPGLGLKLPPEAAGIVRYAERLFQRPAFQKTLK